MYGKMTMLWRGTCFVAMSMACWLSASGEERSELAQYGIT